MLPAETPHSHKAAQLARLQSEHNRYAARLDHIVANPLHSPADLWEEAWLKKMKLKLKDEIEMLVFRSN